MGGKVNEGNNVSIPSKAPMSLTSSISLSERAPSESASSASSGGSSGRDDADKIPWAFFASRLAGCGCEVEGIFFLRLLAIVKT